MENIEREMAQILANLTLTSPAKARIALYILRDPTLSYAEIARRIGVTRQTIHTQFKDPRLRRLRELSALRKAGLALEESEDKEISEE